MSIQSQTDYDSANTSDEDEINPPSGMISFDENDFINILNFEPSYEPVLHAQNNSLEQENVGNLLCEYTGNSFNIGEITITENNELS